MTLLGKNGVPQELDLSATVLTLEFVPALELFFRNVLKPHLTMIQF